jgi:hypothetical protein
MATKTQMTHARSASLLLVSLVSVRADRDSVDMVERVCIRRKEEGVKPEFHLAP